MGSPRAQHCSRLCRAVLQAVTKSFLWALGKILQGSVEGHCPLSSSFPPFLLKRSKTGKKTPNLRGRKMSTNHRKRSYF